MGNSVSGSRKERFLQLTNPICIWAIVAEMVAEKNAFYDSPTQFVYGRWHRKPKRKKAGQCCKRVAKEASGKKTESKKKAEPGAGIKMTEDEHQNDGRPASK